MKARVPGSIEDALMMAYGLIGMAEAEKATGRSPAQLYRFADPDDSQEVTLRQAILLSLACKKSTGETPIMAMFERALDAVECSPEQTPALPISIMDLTAAVGQVAAQARAALDPKGEAGARLSRGESLQLLRQAQTLRDHLDTLDAAIEAHAGISQSAAAGGKAQK